MKFKAKISKIKLFGYHGILIDEQEKGQNFEIDIDYEYSITDNKLNDNIKNTVDYMSVYSLVESVFNNKRYNLLESLSFDIANSLKKKFPILNCKIKIRKPDLIINGKVEFIEVRYSF